MIGGLGKCLSLEYLIGRRNFSLFDRRIWVLFFFGDFGVFEKVNIYMILKVVGLCSFYFVF